MFFTVVNIPAIQTMMAQYMSRVLSNNTGFVISIKSVEIDWLDRFSLVGLKIADKHGGDLLAVESLEVNYKIVSILKGSPNLDQINIDGLKMNLVRKTNDTLNLSKLIHNIKVYLNPKNKKGKLSLSIDNIILNKSYFSYKNGDYPVIANRFDVNNFSFSSINGRLQSLLIKSDTFLVEITALKAIENGSGLAVKKLSTHYAISKKQMRLEQLDAMVGRSKITKNIILNYDGYAALNNFIKNVSMEVELDKAVIYSQDLEKFSPYFGHINDKYIASGSFSGKISDFRVNNLDLKLGKGSNLTGTIYLSGLPDIEETFMNIDLKKSKLFGADLEQYVASKSFSEYNRFRYLKFNGSFTGYTSDFVAYGNFNSDLGTIISDINLKIDENPAHTRYSGKIELVNFDLGKYAKQKSIGKTYLKGKITGHGFQVSTANFSFDGVIDSLELFGYNYSNIRTVGTFEKEYFAGDLAIDDPNIKLKTKNTIDLRNHKNHVIIKGEVDFARLDKLNLIKDHAFVKSKIEADFSGFSLDSILGHLYLEKLYAEHLDEHLDIETLTLNSSKGDHNRLIEFITNRANIKVWGDFNFTGAYHDFIYMFNEYSLSLKNNPDSIAAFYKQNPPLLPDRSYTISASGKFSNIDLFLSLFYPTLSLHQASSIDIFYKHGESSNLSLQFNNDSITYDGNVFINNNINLDASKVIGKPEILAAADIQSEKQLLKNKAQLENLIISAIWQNRTIDFNWYHTQQNIKNINDIYGEIHFYKDSTQIHLNRSNLSLLGGSWIIQDNNIINIANNIINIQNLNIYSEDQMLSVKGEISDNPDKVLAITANNLDIGILNPLISKTISGRLSGEFAISNIYHTPAIVSNFYVNSFYINQFLIGNIYSSNDWNNTKSLFDIQFVVSRDDKPVILVNGIFNPFDLQNAVNLNATFIDAQLNMAEPFVETIFSDLRGGITGNINIAGPIGRPRLSGNGSFNNAGIKINYLNTYYHATGSWSFDSSAIYLKNMVLIDSKGNTANLEGKFVHQNFKNFSIDITGKMDKFMVLNTTIKENELFYGTGIASGNITFTGPIEDITIKAKAITERGTKFYLPMGWSSSSQFEDYISFVDFSDSVNLNSKTEKDVKITGINMDFDLDITQDAYGEIIFDINSGDIIRGRGNGHLSMNINTQGKFNMFGDYEFVEGGYNFTMYNIVNKEFTIKPKSKITWSGDPYNGIMDIDASYKLTTSLAPLVDTTYQDLPDVKRIYPVEVLLRLKGLLLSPDIAFQIIIDDYPKSNVDLDTQIKAFLNTVAVDQQELNRQVFSLLILRRFSLPNSFSSTGTIGSSVSEFVSNQLSYWISQVDENLTIDMEMDLRSMDADALKTFQLRVSYTFMDGKLIVTRDGGFTDPNNEASIGSIAGDWTLEYLLSNDGKLRIKLFNKTNYNQLNSSSTGGASQALISGGFSLIYTTSFDSLSELFNRKKKDKNKEVNNEPSSNALKPEEIKY